LGQERKSLPTLHEEDIVTDPVLASSSSATFDKEVAEAVGAQLGASMSDTVIKLPRAPPPPPSLTPPPDACSGLSAGNSVASSSRACIAAAKVSATMSASAATPLHIAAPEEAEAVAARLGESRAQEFKQAVLQAQGLDPELREGLFALLTTPVGPAIGAAAAKPPRGPSSPPAEPPQSATGASRPRPSEERRARSANSSDPMLGSRSYDPNLGGSESTSQPSRTGQQRRARSAADAEHSLPCRGSSPATVRPATEEAESRPPRSAPTLAAAGRRISEERRAKSALAMNERFPLAPPVKAAALDRNDVLSKFVQENRHDQAGSHLRPASAPEESPRVPLRTAGLSGAPDCTALGVRA